VFHCLIHLELNEPLAHSKHQPLEAKLIYSY
jgi:hypothetical protein